MLVYITIFKIFIENTFPAHTMHLDHSFYSLHSSLLHIPTLFLRTTFPIFPLQKRAGLKETTTKQARQGTSKEGKFKAYILKSEYSNKKQELLESVGETDFNKQQINFPDESLTAE